MATVTAGNYALDMRALSDFYDDGEVLVATNSLIRAETPNGNLEDYQGSFTYTFSGGYQYLTGGTITGLTEYTSGLDLIYRITGMSIPVSTYFSYVGRNDAQGLVAFAMRSNDSISGSSFDDTLDGFAGDDTLNGGAGNDSIYGGAGTDTAVFSGNRADYTIIKANGQLSISDNRGLTGTDGLFGIEYLRFNDTTIYANRAPTVSASTYTPGHNTTVLDADDLFSALDADGDTIQQYWFYDGTVGNGHFVLNGTPLAEKTPLTPIDAADLSNLVFETSGSGSDVLWVQAFDGAVWSAWQSFTVNARTNGLPMIAALNRHPAHGETSIAMDDLFDVTDTDGDTIQQYWFYDATVGNGRLVLNGTPLAEKTGLSPINAADLPNLVFTTSGDGPNVIWIQAYDGINWGPWKTITVNAVPNTAPTVTVVNRHPVHGETSIAMGDLFDRTDADGDPITQYWFYDGTVGNGRLVLNGTPLAEKTALTPINAADLANLVFTTSGNGSDLLWVQAFDGMSWSPWKSFTVNAVPNAAPTITVLNRHPAHGETSINVDDLFNVSDADGDTITQYWFYDGTAGNGRLVLNGTPLAERTPLTPINAADLANLTFETSANGSNLLWVQAFDGTAWGPWRSFTVNAVPNRAPTITVLNRHPAAGEASIAMDDLFDVTDGDGDTIQQYWFYDGTEGNGRLVLSSTPLGEKTPLTPINAADLTNLSFTTSRTGSDLLWVQAFDGTSWGPWKSFTVNARPNALATLTTTDMTVANGSVIQGEDLFDITADPDGDTITKYQIWDGAAGGGTFRLNGAILAAGKVIDVMAGQLAALEFVTGSAGTEQLSLRAFDGYGWTGWKPFELTTLA